MDIQERQRRRAEQARYGSAIASIFILTLLGYITWWVVVRIWPGFPHPPW